MPFPDPGAARARTVLARQRLALSFGGLGALFLGVAAHRERPWLLPVSAALVAVAAVVWRAPRPQVAIAVCTMTAALCAFAVVVAS